MLVLTVDSSLADRDRGDVKTEIDVFSISHDGDISNGLSQGDKSPIDSSEAFLIMTFRLVGRITVCVLDQSPKTVEKSSLRETVTKIAQT